MIIGPTLLGAEPDRSDEGPHKGLRLFQTGEMVALKLMRKLSPELQAEVMPSKGMDDDSLPAGRWNPFDERHLAGARQDNRIVPFGEFNTSCLSSEICLFIYLRSHGEGCPIKLFLAEQQQQIIDLFKAFNAYYPTPVLDHRLRNFKSHSDETYFAWIGPFGEHDAFYYRIHSPVVFMELDFHCGSEFAI